MDLPVPLCSAGFGMFAKPALATYASELTNSVIKEKEQEIDKAKQEKNSYRTV